MKRITLIITLTLAALSFGSCITVDDLRPEDPYESPNEDPNNGSNQGIDKPTITDLTSSGEASNCYIVSSAGTYKFPPVKGNSNEPVGTIASVEVLWESFGTSVTPSVGDLINEVSYSNDYIQFSTPSTFMEGNAVIAAKNSSNEILWSWHIWLTDQPEEQVYANNAGIMMDRNLGATSAAPGDVGALGLLYQWGRKDPFLGSSSISESIETKSTGTWPSAVSASAGNGTIDYATANPMTFIKGTDSSEDDWHYSSRNNDLWKSSKTIYDPCPVGWRVPDGGDKGVWAKACGSCWYFEDYPYDSTDEGMNFSGIFGSASIIWYPASGARLNSGWINDVGNIGLYWSSSYEEDKACELSFNTEGTVHPSASFNRYIEMPVRCLKE